MCRAPQRSAGLLLVAALAVTALSLSATGCDAMLVSVGTNVDSLVAQLDQSIKEADTFISEMGVDDSSKPAS